MLSIIIPIWNQGRVVRENFPHLASILDKIGDDYEVIFIDDGSTDGTPEILKGLSTTFSRIAIFSFPHEGQHPALYKGFKIARGDIVITMDADQKVDPEHIPRLLNKLKEGNDVVVAWRTSRPGLGFFRLFASSLVNWHTNLMTGKKMHDHACCLKAYQGKLIKDNLQRPELRKFFSLWITRHARNVAEVKVECSYKSAKSSSLSSKDSFKLFFDLMRGLRK